MAREKGELIARGGTAEIFAWGDNRVLKLLLEGMPSSDAENEAGATDTAHRAGLPVPAVEGVIEVDGRTGIIFERIEGRSMLAEMMSRPWKFAGFAHMLAELQFALHSREVTELRPLHELLQQKIRDAEGLPEKTREAVLKILQQIPDGNSICHGDFHPDNIIMSTRGPVIIDLIDAARGNPLGDVARTSLLLRLPGMPPGYRGGRLIDFARRRFHNIYIKHYLKLCQLSREELDAWLPVVAAARLEEQLIPEYQRPLLLVLAGKAVSSRR